MEELGFSGFVGIDWGEKKHQVCVLDGAGRVRGNRAFSHRGKGLRALVKWLKKTTGVSPASVAVVIERPDGPVVATLLAAGFAVPLCDQPAAVQQSAEGLFDSESGRTGT